jgi:hypothetical protein
MLKENRQKEIADTALDSCRSFLKTIDENEILGQTDLPEQPVICMVLVRLSLDLGENILFFLIFSIMDVLIFSAAAK